eukprot:TRINITY_DN1018_c0_g1_i1.p1 TRINITY_DN1018_c0_g1~~TRINITY_DN1018_c0_g1_i1.p1  ORF type:complete len:358 (-),score=51.65 TRINITY_DN1018_c0_g1_i1:122-1195(-)
MMDIDRVTPISEETMLSCLRTLMQMNTRRKIFSMEEIMHCLDQNLSANERVCDWSRDTVHRVMDGSSNFQIGKNGYSLKKGLRKLNRVNLKPHSTSSSNSKKKKSTFLWCHQCKQKHEKVYYCCHFQTGACTKKYCKGCIERHYMESADEIDENTWVCMFCRNICTCAFCRRKRGEGSSFISSKPAPDNRRVNSDPVAVVKTHKKREKLTNSDSAKPKIISPEVTVTLRDLINTNFLTVGDKIFLAFSSRFCGELLSDGKIYLEWCGSTVENLDDFIACTQSCHRILLDPWNSTICNGQKLVHFRNAYLLNQGKYNYLAPPRSRASTAMDVDEGFDSGQFDNDQLSMFYVRKLDFEM